VIARRGVLALTLFAAVACAVPYQPAQRYLPMMSERAFDRAVSVVRAEYPRLAVVNEPAFRIQSNWIPHDPVGLTGEKRATVYVEQGMLSVVVETRYLGVGLTGAPAWSAVRGDPGLERALLDKLVAALGQP